MFKQPIVVYNGGRISKIYYTFHGTNIGGDGFPDIYVSQPLANTVFDLMEFAEEIGQRDANLTP